MSGFMWVAGGIGACDEEDWDTPDDVLDDDWCASCVLSGTVTGITPPKFKLSMDGPDVDRNTKLAIRYCLEHPRWRLSLQTQKYIGIA